MIDTLVITPGEPAGIGPDICLRIAERRWPCRLVWVADRELLRERARLLRVSVELIDEDECPEASPPGVMIVRHVPTAVPVQPGRLDPANAPYVLNTLQVAVDACREGRYLGLVTAPVHKGVINDAGIPFTGHTEWLAQRCQAWPVMMLATDRLRVALLTTHLPLRDVAAQLTPELLTRTLDIIDRDLRQRFHLVQPRILVCGLNPHAGEGGHLGSEEQQIMIPVLETLRQRGLSILGPVPADTAFIPYNLARCDLVLALYHDQGLPVLKAQGFGEAVNITLGLPIIRTSVDHGTALELAGTGWAESRSLEQAIIQALRMAGRPTHESPAPESDHR